MAHDKDRDLVKSEEVEREEERLKREAALRIARLEAQWRLFTQRGGQWIQERK